MFKASIGWPSLTLSVLVLALSAYPQTASTGAITGTVTDPSGAVVPSASVVVKSNATGYERKFTTDSVGNFSASLLPPGTYTVSIQAAGFLPLTIQDVVVQITEVTPTKAQLSLGAKKQEVVVRGVAPLLQTANATVGRVISHQTVVDLPLVNRNYTQILGLTAGTNTNVVDATALGNGSQEIRANGARSGDNNFMINGVDANSYGTNLTEQTAFAAGGISIPAPDSIQEFKVQTSLYDAQYGRGSGTNVNIETRSGTSEYHGNLYFFGRNDALNANNFFANATGTPKGKFLRSQPGFTFGGPTLKNRIFFFLSEQNTRDVNGASLDSSLRSLTLPPIPLDRSPQSLGAVFDGETGAFGGVAIAPDGSNINPVALALLNVKNPDGTFLIPSPQTSGTGVNFTASIPGRFREDQFNTNLDFNLSDSDRLSTKFFLSHEKLTIPFFGANVPGFPSLRTFRNRNLSIAETHIFSPTLVNQIRLGYSRVAGAGGAGGTVRDTDVGIQRFSDPGVDILPQIQVLGAFTLGNSANDRAVTANNNFHYQDTLSWTRGTHNLRIGGEVFRNQFNEKFDFSSGFILNLSFPDFLLGLPAGPASAGGNDTPFSNIFFTTVTAGVVSIGERATAYDFFVQDDWKVKPHLTLNLGLRLEVNGQQSESRGRQSNFFPEFFVQPPPGGFTTPAQSGFVLPDNFSGSTPPGIPRRNPTLLNNSAQYHPEPRIGFAYSPLTNFVVRGGYGIFANRVSFVGNGNQLIFNPPFTFAVALAGAAAGFTSLQSPFPNLPSNSTFPNFIANMLPGPPFDADRVIQTPSITDPDFKESTVQHWGLDLQYSFKDYVFSAGYSGAKGTHLQVGRSINQPPLASPSNPVNGLTDNSPSNATSRVPFFGLSPLMFRVESSGNSIYNAFEFTAMHRMSHGFQFLAAYTLSKSIDDAADSLGAPNFGAFGVPIVGELVFNNQNNRRAQRGLSDFDRRHRFVLSYVWDLPAGRLFANSWARQLATGWSLSGVTTIQSGTPFSIVDSGAGTLFGQPSLFFTASLAPGKTLSDARRAPGTDKVNQFFNPAAFEPASFVPDGGLIDGQFPVIEGGTLFGNLGRNILRGPDQRDVDFAISKRTRLTEKFSLILRWEMFNVFNRANFANPGNDVEAPGSFGVIGGLTVNPRIMQYAVKLEF